MLKKLDNSFSLSMPELKNQTDDILKKIDIGKEIEKNINLIKKYLIEDTLYDEWTKSIYQKFHSSIPKEVKDKCKVCKGDSELTEDKACQNYFSAVNDEFLILITLYVGFIENNKHLFKSKELVKSLTNNFFENFEYNEGKSNFNTETLDNTLLTNALLLLRESFVEMETHTAITKINQIIEELETHIIIATSTNRIVFDFVKPQLKFLKKQLKYYNKKREIELLSPPPSNSIDQDVLFKLNNNLIPRLSIEQVYNYFKILTQVINSKQKFYLNEEKLIIFIKATFVDCKPIKQNFDVEFSRDKIDIRSVFQNFLTECSKFEKNNKNLKEKYFNIMNNSFYGFNLIDHEKFHKTSNKIITIKLHKSK
ncbi:hypothetical protein [Algibacter sp. L1A34]|uniref:hypothetical protein n=1 Tax=Algibacter sp. L1A34 TaxID=2686365 RepID=UPI00131B89B5|nr:hypothetical protein [Algibacter sp. L1A34]